MRYLNAFEDVKTSASFPKTPEKAYVFNSICKDSKRQLPQ